MGSRSVDADQRRPSTIQVIKVKMTALSSSEALPAQSPRLDLDQDDSIDWDQGFKGTLQYVVVQQNPLTLIKA